MAQHPGADLVADLAHLCQMRVYLVAGLMDVFQLRAGQLELPARLQRDRAAVLMTQRDDVVAFVDRHPAEALHAFEQERGFPAGRHRAAGACPSNR